MAGDDVNDAPARRFRNRDWPWIPAAEGEIVSVGEGARKDSGELIAPSVKVGDRVLFGKWSGTEVTVDGKDLLIMKESDILGIIA